MVIDRADGIVATFRVDRVEEHAKDDFPTEEVYGDIDHAGLRLITCGGAFDEDTGDNLANVIVFASLTGSLSEWQVLTRPSGLVDQRFFRAFRGKANSGDPERSP